MIAQSRESLVGRFRLSTQMYVGIGAAVLLTLSATLVAWQSFDEIGDRTDRVSDERVPEMVASFGIAQYTGVLAAAAPRLTSAVTQGEFDQDVEDIAATEQLFEQELASIAAAGTGADRLARVRQLADQLKQSVATIESDKQELLDLGKRTAAVSIELAQLQQRLDEMLIPAIDDQLFYTMTGYDQLGEGAAPNQEHFSDVEFYRYRNVADLQSAGNTATQLLASAFTVSDAAFIEPLRERSEAARSRIDRSLSVLHGTEFAAIITPTFNRLFDISLGDGGGFELLARTHALTARQQDLVELNRGVAIALVDEVDELVKAAESSVSREAEATEQSIWQGRLFLIAISAASVIGAFLITYLFVGRVLLRRIQTLSNRMLSMAGGDLETKVEISGKDEVAEMADALEVFRQHALEVQRLNLVEQLADELQGKNEQLESVLDDLQNAQDQIITQGKLAALGELTAGVAHEIRNPLNFVNNFSEASEELLQELNEILEEIEDDIDDEQKDYIEEITGDLVGNLQRIKSHGDRANRIVHGMLAMGRESTDVQETDLNALVEEYAQLAYHSGRATDPDMNMEIKMEFDPEVPPIQAIPQDLGRVFLNLVTNSWHATEDKRNTLREQDPDVAGEYVPGLNVSSRLSGDSIEVRFRDNGTGMPPDVVERIFNPFFTTKDTDRGTGLGLSLSMDIIRSHGGNITVNTEPGQFTEFLITLPRQSQITRPTVPLVEDDEADEDEDQDH